MGYAVFLPPMTSRLFFTALAAAASGLLLVGFFLEQAFGLTPCPLCMLQRFAYFAVLLVSAAAAWPENLSSRAIRRFAVLAGLFAAAGLAVAGRQIWLLSLPHEEAAACAVVFGSSLERMLSALGGTADCLDQTWTFIGLSIPEWSFLWFGAFVAVAFQVWRGALRQRGIAIQWKDNQ